jgi:hypothetical protein
VGTPVLPWALAVDFVLVVVANALAVTIDNAASAQIM